MPTQLRSLQRAALEEKLATHAVCDDYENDWKDGPPPSMRPYLDRAPEKFRIFVLAELLAGVDERFASSSQAVDVAELRRIADVSDEEFDQAKIVWESKSNPLTTAESASFPEPAPPPTTNPWGGSTAAFPGRLPTTASEESVIQLALAFDDYSLEDVLGIGGMGVVYRAYQHSQHRRVALKIIKGDYLRSPTARLRFDREIEASCRLNHPHIVSVYDHGEQNGAPYYAMELVEGSSLKEFVSVGEKESGRKEAPPRLDPLEAARIMELIAGAAQYAHQKGVVHRDVTPANILLDKSGTPKLVDFGLSKLTASEDGRTLITDVTIGELGTRGYMAPEQVTNGDITPLTDVYGLGASLYALLAGHAPFQGTAREVGTKTLHERPRRLSAIIPGIPIELETICDRCLSKRPADRIASAGALAEDLRRFREGAAIKARPIGLVEFATRWCGRNPLTASLIAAVLLALIIGFVVSTLLAIRATREANRANDALETGKALIEETFLVASQDLKDDPGSQGTRNDLLEKAKGFYKMLAAKNANDSALGRESAKANYQLGQVALELKQFDDAEENLRTAEKLQQALREGASENVELLCELADTQQATSKLFAEKYAAAKSNNAKEAAENLLDQWIVQASNAREARGQAADVNPSNFKYKRDEANSLESLAAAHAEQATMMEKAEEASGCWEMSFKELELAQTLREQAVEEADDEVDKKNLQRELARGYANMANARQRYGAVLGGLKKREAAGKEFERAYHTYNQAVGQYETLADWLAMGNQLTHTSPSEIEYGLSECRRQLGLILLGTSRRTLDRTHSLLQEASNAMALASVRNPRIAKYRETQRSALLIDLQYAENSKSPIPLIDQLVDQWLQSYVEQIAANPAENDDAKKQQVDKFLADLGKLLKQIDARGSEYQRSIVAKAVKRLEELQAQSRREYEYLTALVEKLEQLEIAMSRKAAVPPEAAASESPSAKR